MLFSFSKSKAEGTFSDYYKSPVGLVFVNILAEAEEERTAAG